MKRIYTSLGMAAIGVASIQGVQGQVAPVDASKSWSVSTSLRGFYDDNVLTTANNEIESYGVEASPSLAFALALGNTDISGNYTFSHKWYDKAIGGNGDHDSDQHVFGAQLRHSFSERLIMSVQDSFVIGQEPDVLAVPGTAQAEPQYVSGNNYRNYGSITFNDQITRLFGMEAGYANGLYHYVDDSVGGSAARLNRLEHAVHVDGRWTIQPDTVGIIGTQFRLTDYTADELLGSGSTLKSGSRNVRLYYLYAGLEHTFRPDLTGSVRAGASYADYYNSPNNDTSVSPYGQASLSYQYAKECTLNFGVSTDQSATDSYSVEGNSITTGAQSTVAYVAVNHRITPYLFGSVSGQYQYSSYVGGTLDGDSQSLYSVGVNLEYRINRHLSANAGYNYDALSTDQPNSSSIDYGRNRVYIGLSAVY